MAPPQNLKTLKFPPRHCQAGLPTQEKLIEYGQNYLNILIHDET